MRVALNIRCCIAVGILVAGVVSAEGIASARTEPGSMGVAVPYSHQYCWSLFFDTISNGCGDVETLDIPILYEWSGPGGGGWTAMYVNAFGASANNNVGCQAVSVDGVHATNNLTYWASGYYYLPQFGHTQTLMLGNGVWVPAQGYEFVTCQVSPGGQINNIYYEPGW